MERYRASALTGGVDAALLLEELQHQTPPLVQDAPQGAGLLAARGAGGPRRAAHRRRREVARVAQLCSGRKEGGDVRLAEIRHSWEVTSRLER